MCGVERDLILKAALEDILEMGTAAADMEETAVNAAA